MPSNFTLRLRNYQAKDIITNKKTVKNTTVIYYTSNQEEESFEQKIREKLLQVIGELPLISVSHKAIDFGKNICIGVHKPANKMIYTQLLIGCKEAKTPFIINAEADFLYCPEYFNFVPPKTDQIYRYNNIRVAYKYHWGFFKKAYSEGAQIAGRNYLISLLEKALEKAPKGETKFNAYKDIPLEMYGGPMPCVTFKTGDSLHKYVAFEREKSVHELPYWGSITDMRKELFPEVYT